MSDGFQERLRVAGEAAQILEEEHGCTAVARLKDGVVAIEAWTPTGGRRRFVVGTDVSSPRALADICATELGKPEGDLS